MTDIYKYASAYKGYIYVCIDKHTLAYASTNLLDTSPLTHKNASSDRLRLYRYDVALTQDTRVLVAENLIDCGSTSMKITLDGKLIIATGQADLAFSPRLQVIDLEALNASGNNTYPLETYLIDGAVSEIVDII